MAKYHKIVINGEVQFREVDESTGFYENTILTEDELVEQLLDDAIQEVIEIDKGQVERIISFLPQPFHREQVQTYIDYLENLVESFE
ncbi:hypothetical protein [Bacillus sp. SJS]|uniref:hypothetical protein n=1 Tax=Bacillus sp. SJS TaxID=1423321 RepID=UPI0004DD5595|nr:hypothetical protein [Bacillus sp. SJS]KZZ85054.1 hypothetical protein AS29_008375 [Bacillus sp. SJS]